jgi:methylmalonyl-CoA/ethylmalonyl-CoA epimerase
MTDKSSATGSWILTQVGVVVKDMGEAIERLQACGIGPFSPKILPDGVQEWYREKPWNGKSNIQATMLGGVELEIIAPVPGVQSPHREYLESKGEGIQHLMFQVTDLDKEVARLKEAGATELLRAKHPSGRGICYLDLNAGGIIVELSQKPPK